MPSLVDSSNQVCLSPSKQSRARAAAPARVDLKKDNLVVPMRVMSKWEQLLAGLVLPVLENCPGLSFRRVPETDSAMVDLKSVDDFDRAGSSSGPIVPVYCFHLAQLAQMIRPGDTVLDLGCGPCNHLILEAKTFPDVKFIGVDSSPVMLKHAEQNIRLAGLTNVEVVQSDMTNLQALKIRVPQFVQSIYALHHLLDNQALERTIAEVKQILPRDGGFYLSDFCRLRTRLGVNYIANLERGKFGAHYDDDLFASLQAAFEARDFKQVQESLISFQAELYIMKPIPLLMVLKSARRVTPIARRWDKIGEELSKLDSEQRKRFITIASYFERGGLEFPSLSKLRKP